MRFKLKNILVRLNRGNKNQAGVINYDFWFYGFVTIHVFFWTIIPTLLRHTLPMDALEGFVWGQSLQLGYDRNPWLNAWLTEFAVKIGGQSGWLVYFLSQVCVALGFFAIWKLGKKILHPAYALIAVLILEGAQYYNLAAIDFNDNVLEIGLWALLILSFYSAIKKQNVSSWLVTGLVSSLALMAKYYAIMLFAPLLIVLLTTKEGRKSFTKLPLYCGLLTFALVVLPHCVWLFSNHFATLEYAVMRVSSASDFSSTPLYFLLMQLLTFLVPLLLYAIIFTGKKKSNNNLACIAHNFFKKNVTSFDKLFLLILGFGPLLFTVVAATLGGMTLHTMWGTPLLSLWGLILVAFTQPQITSAKFYRLVATVFVVFAVLLAGYCYSIMFHGYNSSANYPGKNITTYVMQCWDNSYPSTTATAPPAYIVGDRYTAGNLAYFAKTNPKVYVIDEKSIAQPSIISPKNIGALESKGVIFVWRADKEDEQKFYSAFVAKFPRIKIIETKEFSIKRNASKPPLKIGFAFLKCATNPPD